MYIDFLQKIIALSLIFLNGQIYGAVIYSSHGGSVALKVAEQAEDFMEIMTTKAEAEAIKAKGQRMIENADETLAMAMAALKYYEFSRIKAKSNERALEEGIRKLDEDMFVAKQDLHCAEATLPAKGICVPVIYPYGSCYEYMRHEHNWYYRCLKKDEDILREQCEYYFAKDSEALREIIAEDCKKEDLQHCCGNWEGCFFMVRYALRARDDEQRHANCSEIKNTVERLENRIVELDAAKQDLEMEVESTALLARKTLDDIEEVRLIARDSIFMKEEIQEMMERAGAKIGNAKKSLQRSMKR